MRSIAWVVPYPLKGSGGHRTIYQNLAALVEAGYECHVYLEQHPPPGLTRILRSADEGKALAESYFGPIPATFHLGTEVTGVHDVVFATAWFTADAVRRVAHPCKKAYFVQDYEAAFMPMSDHYLLAQNTFRYGFEGVTIGRWLTQTLESEFEMRSSFFDFCADHAVYRPLEVERELAVCFVYQPEKPRRCSLIGGQALTIVKQEMPEVQVYFYGNDQAAAMPFELSHLGLIPVEKCNELYNRCAVGLCFSATNPSRIPFEMMAAGLPVVDIWGKNTIYDLPEAGVRLTEPTPESVAYTLLGLLRDPAARRALSEGGRAFMRERNLAYGFRQFVAFVEGLFDKPNGKPARSAALSPLYHAPAVRAPEDEARRLRAPIEVVHEVRGEDGPAPPKRIAPPTQVPPSIPSRIVHRLQHTLRVLLTGA